MARLRDSEKKAERGSTVIIANFATVEVEDDDGEKKTVNVPRSMGEIIDTINQRMEDWPRRVDNMLFVDDAVQSMALFVTNNQTSQLVLTRTVQSDSGVSTLFTDKEQP